MNLSGLNSNSSSHSFLFLCSPKKKGIIIVFFGKENSPKLSSSIATRSVIHAAGYKRIPSLIVAFMYSSFIHSKTVMLFSEVVSVCSFSIFEDSKNSSHESVFAVVSCPAKIIITNSSIICSSDMDSAVSSYLLLKSISNKSE